MSAQLDGIQVLRAVAALLVFTHHMTLELLANSASPALLALYPVGLGGVHLFFVISGFLIVYTTRNTFGSARSAGLFFYHRLARIAPLYLVFTVLFAVVAIVLGSNVNNNAVSLLDLFRSFLFIPYENPEGKFHPVFGVGWTINYDMALYAIFAPFVFLKRPYAMPAFCIAVLALLTIGLLVTPAQGALWFWTRPILLEMLGGAVLGWVFVSGRFVLPRAACWLLISAGVAWWILAFGDAPAGVWDVERFSSQYAYLERGLPAVMILAGLTLSPKSQRSVWRENPLGRFLLAVGDRSYSLSMAHLFMLRALTIAMPVGLLGAAYVPVYIAVALVAVVPATLLTYECLEKPLGRLTRPSKKTQNATA